MGLAIGAVGLGLGLVIAWILGGVVPGLRYEALKTVRKAMLGVLGVMCSCAFFWNSTKSK